MRCAIWRIPAIGHLGTLDPLATGVLVLLLGRATAWCSSMPGAASDMSGLSVRFRDGNTVYRFLIALMLPSRTADTKRRIQPATVDILSVFAYGSSAEDYSRAVFQSTTRFRLVLLLRLKNESKGLLLLFLHDVLHAQKTESLRALKPLKVEIYELQASGN